MDRLPRGKNRSPACTICGDIAASRTVLISVMAKNPILGRGRIGNWIFRVADPGGFWRRASITDSAARRSLAFPAPTFLVVGITVMFFGWLPLYLPELFPTRVRATGQGLAFNAGRILAAVGALQMGAMMQTLNGSYAQAGAVISLVYGVGLVLSGSCPRRRANRCGRNASGRSAGVGRLASARPRTPRPRRLPSRRLQTGTDCPRDSAVNSCGKVRGVRRSAFRPASGQTGP